MNGLPALLLAALAIVTCVLLKRLGMPPVNPVSVVTAAWMPAIVIAALPGVVEPSLTVLTFDLLIGGFLIFASTVYIGFRLIEVSRRRPRHSLVPQEVPMQSRTLAILHLALSTLLVGFIALQVSALFPAIERLGGPQAIFLGGGALIREFQEAQRSSQLSQAFTGGSLALSALGYLLFLGHGALFTGAALWLRGRRALAVVPLALLGVLSLLVLARTFFVMGVILFTTAVLAGRGVLHTVPRVRLNARRAMLLVMACTVSVIVLLAPLILRNTGTLNSTGVASLFQYFVSGIAGLNASVGSSQSSAFVGARSSVPIGFGAYTFSGVASILHRIGLPVLQTPANYGYVTVWIGGVEFTTNVGTSLADLFFDGGGFMGALVAVAVAGLLAGGVQGAYTTRAHTWLLPALSWFLALFAWSFFGNVMTRDLRYCTLAAVGVLAMLAYRLREQARLAGAMKREGDRLATQSRISTLRDDDLSRRESTLLRPPTLARKAKDQACISPKELATLDVRDVSAPDAARVDSARHLGTDAPTIGRHR